MKKIKKQRLVLSRETVRTLDLTKVTGAINATSIGCSIDCTNTCPTASCKQSVCNSCFDSQCCLSSEATACFG